MAEDDPGRVTLLLQQIRDGDQQAENDLMPIVYRHLHQIADQVFKKDQPSHPLQPTVLVNEFYLRVLKNSTVDWKSESHLYALAARTIRRILADHARAANLQRRPLPKNRIALEDILISSEGRPIDVLVLEQALTELAAREPRQGQVVEMRFFAGLSVEQTAAVLGVSELIVKEDWRLAQSWLTSKLGDSDSAAAAAGSPAN